VTTRHPVATPPQARTPNLEALPREGQDPHGVQSAECGVQSAECRVQSAECRVRSAECAGSWGAPIILRRGYYRLLGTISTSAGAVMRCGGQASRTPYTRYVPGGSKAPPATLLSPSHLNSAVFVSRGASVK
jgi:hypothetical protein